MAKSKNSAFTLVELIVVIVILAILATIAFLSFSSQSSSARDSTRMADISNIVKGTMVFSAVGGSNPIPDKSVNIMSGSTQIGYQGEAGVSLLGMIKFSAGGGKDPLNGTYYTYNTNYTKNKIQVLGFLENPPSFQTLLNPFHNINQSFATDYTARYPYEKGDGLGVILAQSGTTSPTYTPLQDSIPAGTGFDTLSGTTSSGKVVVIDNSSSSLPTVASIAFIGYTGTGASALGVPAYNPVNSYTAYTALQKFSYSGANVTVTSAGIGTSDSKAEPGCDTFDIAVWKSGINPVIISACNIGSTVYGTGVTSYGKYFEWGRNKGFVIGDATQTGQIAGNVGLNAATDSQLFYISGALSSPYTWASTAIDGNWGGSGADVPTSDAVGTTAAGRQGPCQTGFHVPSAMEWQNVCNSIYNTTCTTRAYDSYLNSILKLPLMGRRNYQDGLAYWTTDAYYWTSSPNSTTYAGTFILMTPTNTIYPNYGYARAYGMPIRCVKN